MMRRRSVLFAFGAVTFAGCVGFMETYDPNVAALYLIEEIVIYNDYEVALVEFDESENVLRLDYVTQASHAGELGGEITMIAGAFAGVSENVTAELLAVTAINDTGQVQWTYHIETEWAQAYNVGRLHPGRYLPMILATLDPPLQSARLGAGMPAVS